MCTAARGECLSIAKPTAGGDDWMEYSYKEKGFIKENQQRDDSLSLVILFSCIIQNHTDENVFSF